MQFSILGCQSAPKRNGSHVTNIIWKLPKVKWTMWGSVLSHFLQNASRACACYVQAYEFSRNTKTVRSAKREMTNRCRTWSNEPLRCRFYSSSREPAFKAHSSSRQFITHSSRQCLFSSEGYTWMCLRMWGHQIPYRKKNDRYMYAVQQDTQSVLMSKFIQHLC